MSIEEPASEATGRPTPGWALAVRRAARFWFVGAITLVLLGAWVAQAIDNHNKNNGDTSQEAAVAYVCGGVDPEDVVWEGENSASAVRSSDTSPYDAFLFDATERYRAGDRVFLVTAYRVGGSNDLTGRLEGYRVRCLHDPGPRPRPGVRVRISDFYRGTEVHEGEVEIDELEAA